MVQISKRLVVRKEVPIDNSRELTPAVKITKPGDMGEDYTGSQTVNS